MIRGTVIVVEVEWSLVPTSKPTCTPAKTTAIAAATAMIKRIEALESTRTVKSRYHPLVGPQRLCRARETHAAYTWTGKVWRHAPTTYQRYPFDELWVSSRLTMSAGAVSLCYSGGGRRGEGSNVNALARLPRRSVRRPIVALLAVAAMAYALTSISATPAATPGLVAAFAFDEGSGSVVADGSGSGNNGSVANTAWVAGKYGGALSFNGTSSRVTVPDSASLHLSSAMTLEAWVNPATTTAAWRDVIYKGNDNYYLEGTSDSGGRPAAGGTFGDTYGTSALAVNTWSYLAVSYDRTTIRLYVNGTQVSSLAATGAIASSTNPLSIGSDSLYGQYFQGLIDDVRVYNTALTQAQIQTDMTTPVAPPAPDTSPPSAPGALSANAVSGSRVDLSWGTASDNVGVTGYRVERCQGAGCSNFAQIATTAGTTTSYSDTTASAGTSYSYRVRANDAAANLGPYSNTATATTPSPDTSPPSAPGTLSANAVSGSRVDLSWGTASDNVGVTGYRVERCQGAGCSNFAQIATTAGTTTSYSDTTASAGTSYSYRVRANDAAANLGPYSNTATATTPSPDTSPPSAPGTLSANAVSGSRVDLSWGTASDNVGVTGYRVERCQGAGCSNFAQIATTAGTTTSYSDTTASAGTSYSYRVRANDAAANLGPYSNTATATTPSPTGPAPVAAFAFDEGSGSTVCGWVGERQ